MVFIKLYYPQSIVKERLKNVIVFLSLTFFFLLFLGRGALCATNPNKKNCLSIAIPSSSVSLDSLETLFPKPKIPLTISNPSQQALYYLKHFWDNFDFKKGATILQSSQKKALLERDFRDFLAISLSLPLLKGKKYFLTPAKESTEDLFYFFDELYAKYLNEETSSLKNEEYYIALLEYYVQSPKTDFATLVRSRDVLKLARRNRVGTIAENFLFILASGEVKQLIHYRGKPTILFFYTPGCEGCRKATEEIKHCTLLNTLLEQQKINLLYIYAENNPIAFKESLESLPKRAIAGINSNGVILNTPLYDLRNSPTIYLLDTKGKVKLKNTAVKELVQFFQKRRK